MTKPKKKQQRLYVMLAPGMERGRLERGHYPAAHFLRRKPRPGEFDRSWRLFVEVKK